MNGMNEMNMSYYDRGAPTIVVVFSGVSQFGSLRPLPKTGLEKNKTAPG